MIVSGVHITGAACSGVTTLGAALAKRMGALQLDTDDFYWAPIEPRYFHKREISERLELLRGAMEAAGPKGWILSGSIDDWGDSLIPYFKLVVFVRTATATRIERLKAREIEKFGHAAIAEGGPRYNNYQWFLKWATDYDSGTDEGRDLAMHEAFLARLPCEVLRVDGARDSGVLVDTVVARLGEL